MNLLITTVPKTGTHLVKQIVGSHEWLPLLEHHYHVRALRHLGVVPHAGAPIERRTYVARIIGRLSDRKGSIFLGHIGYDPEIDDFLSESQTVLAMLVRDPRDTAVSLAHAAMRGQARYNFHLSDGSQVSDQPDPLWWAIMFSPALWALYLPWFERADVILRFEQLIDSQLEEAIRPLEEFVDMKGARERLDPSKSNTFRKGIAGEWKHEFGAEHHRIFNETMAEVMDLLNYEPYTWTT